MDPVPRHRYVYALISAGVLFLIGTVIVINRAGLSPVNTSGTLNITGVLLGGNSALPIPPSPPPARPEGVTLPFVHISATTTAKNPSPSPSPETPLDWNSFVALLTHPPVKNGGAATTSTSYLSEAYSFIPTGLISLSEPQSAMTIPDSEKPLYAWGQDAGEIIQGFEGDHPNQPQILTDYIQDRENPTKIAAMKKLGEDLTAVGDGIAALDPLPGQMTTAGPALAAAYREIGSKLAAIPDAKGDDATVKAILAYDKSAEAFVGKFVAVVTIFQANGVKYSQSEPGGVFMFPNQ